MIKTVLQNEIAKAVKKLYNKTVDFEVVQDEKFGDYSTNVAMLISAMSFEFKEYGNPREAAEKIKAQLLKFLNINRHISRIEIAGPGFINFFARPDMVQKQFCEIYKKGEKWGKPTTKTGKVIIDFSAPNIAKPMSVGHLRSTIIGQALYNIFKFAGWKTIGDNHLGDWGKQFGMLISAYKDSPLKNKKDIHIQDLMELYVDFNTRMKADPKLEELAREETKKLQNGDVQNIKIWKRFYKISLDEFRKVYKILNIKFDYYLGESFYNPMLKGIVEEALEKGVAKKSEGAVIIEVDGCHTPFLIRKSDDAFLYQTTDLATIKYRAKKFAPDKILYVVGNEQSLPFEQLFKVAPRLGFGKGIDLSHVKFGMLLGEDMKKFSTRAGKHVSLLGVIDEAKERALKVVEEKQPELKTKEKEKIAEAVGVGALKYNDLSQNRLSDIVFNWDKMLSFEGNSAPYLQYTYARLKSILRKGKFLKFHQKYLEAEIEKKLILRLAEFPEVIEKVMANYYPHYLSDYLYKLAKETNYFYQIQPVLNAPRGAREARLALIKSVATTLKTGLELLGIKTLEKM